MILTLQNRNILTIPRDLREALDLEAGDPIEATVEGGRLVLTPVAVVPRTMALTENGAAKEAEADADLAAGRLREFDSAEGLLRHLADETPR